MSRSLSQFVGSSSAQFLAELLPATEAQSITLVHYEPTMTLARRADVSPRVADDISPSLWIPDYELLFARRLVSGIAPLDLIDWALEHRGNPANRKRITLSASELTVAKIESIRSERPGWALAFSSRVQTSAGERHLPMMDFQCPVGDIYRESVCHAMASASPSEGVIVESGLSYHYFAASLVTTEDWRTFLGRCLLLSPFTDTRYIGHRIIDRESVLRIASDAVKPRTPVVVAVVNGR